MLIFAFSSFLHSKNSKMNTLSKKELRETIETLRNEHAQVAKTTK